MKDNKNANGSSLLAIILILAFIGGILYLGDSKGFFSLPGNLKFDKKENKENKNEVKPINYESCINTDNIYSKSETNTAELLGMSAKIDINQSSVVVTINHEKFEENVPESMLNGTNYSKQVSSYQISNFTKKVHNAFIGTIGQGVWGAKIFFLMEDGSVTYVSIFKDILFALSEDAVPSNLGHSEIEYFEEVSVSSASSIGGYTSVAAVKKDGSFYDLVDLSVVEENEPVNNTEPTENNNDNNNTNNSNVSVNNDSKITNVNIDSNISTNSIVFSGMRANDPSYCIDVSVGRNRNAWNLTYDYMTCNETFGSYLNEQLSKQTKIINGTFNRKVEQVYIGNEGQGSPKNETILFLMEDGTVEYIPVLEGVLNNNGEVKSYGKIKNVENIQRIMEIDVFPAGAQMGGYITTALIRTDGSYYTLGNVLYS